MRGLSRLTVAVIALVVGLASVSSAQTVDEVVAKNIKAKGGAEKWKSIQSVRLTGKITAQGIELPMVTESKRPNLMRQEMMLQDKKLVQAFDGGTAWMINPMMGSDTAQELSGPQADMMKDEADFDSVLLDYKAKGVKVELVPSDRPEDKGLLHLKVTRKSGRIQDLYIDAETGLDVKSVSTIDQNGQTLTITSEPSNYQDVQGVMVPFSMRQSVNGTQVASMTIDKVEFNVPIDEAVFKMPAKK